MRRFKTETGMRYRNPVHSTEKGGLHAFRHRCNRGWELAGIDAALIRQQLGHTSQRIYISGEIPLAQVTEAFSRGTKIDVLENMENEPAA